MGGAAHRPGLKSDRLLGVEAVAAKMPQGIKAVPVVSRDPIGRTPDFHKSTIPAPT